MHLCFTLNSLISLFLSGIQLPMEYREFLNSLQKAIVFTFLILFAFYAQAEIAPDIKHIEPPGSILFVGNSLTRGNEGIYEHLKQLLAESGQAPAAEIYNITKNGAALLELSAQANQLIAAKRWGAVVLQEYSNTPVENYDAFTRGVQSMMLDIRMQRAQPVLFMTWAYNEQPEMTIQLRDAYVLAGNQFKALVVPVGLAYAKAVEALPQVSFYLDDRHSTLAGTYLASCVFYTSLFGQPSSGITYTAGLPKELAEKLQAIADETVKAFYSAG